MKIVPAQDRILVVMAAEERIGSIITPGQNRRQSVRAQVVSVGHLTPSETATTSRPSFGGSLKEGDIIHMSPAGGCAVVHEGKQYIYLSLGEILGKLEPGEMPELLQEGDLEEDGAAPAVGDKPPDVITGDAPSPANVCTCVHAPEQHRRMPYDDDTHCSVVGCDCKASGAKEDHPRST